VHGVTVGFVISSVALQGSSTREQLELIIGKLGSPKTEDLHGMPLRLTECWAVPCCVNSDTTRYFLAGINGRHVLETIRRMGDKVCLPFGEMFPGTNPLALDLLSKLLMFDQFKRITVEVSTA
jgi:hypothetical protein